MSQRGRYASLKSLHFILSTGDSLKDAGRGVMWSHLYIQELVLVESAWVGRGDMGAEHPGRG